MSRIDRFGIYLHIPYCRAKCRYCDFYSAPGARGVPQAYVDALLRELKKNPRRPDTLYFGGGTPSLLTPGQAAALRHLLRYSVAEIFLPFYPETVKRRAVSRKRELPNRRIVFCRIEHLQSSL